MKLTINKLSFNYVGIPVLKDVELEVGLGEMLSIVRQTVQARVRY